MNTSTTRIILNNKKLLSYFRVSSHFFVVDKFHIGAANTVIQVKRLKVQISASEF